MNRIVGLETEYGCLISEDQAQSQADAWPVKVKNYLFRIFDKLGVSSRVEVVLYVFRLRKDLAA